MVALLADTLGIDLTASAVLQLLSEMLDVFTCLLSITLEHLGVFTTGAVHSGVILSDGSGPSVLALDQVAPLVSWALVSLDGSHRTIPGVLETDPVSVLNSADGDLVVTG